MSIHMHECENGHLYDAEQYTNCPYCLEGGNRIDFGNNTVGRTVADENVSVTVAPMSYNQQGKGNVGKTVGVFQKRMKFEPVVGWLVCFEGPEKGKDYRVYGRNNNVGRSEQMDICIKGDTTISRENHAKIAYDEKHNTFYLIPADSTNTIYLNDEPVYIPTKIKAYDLMEFGDSKFIFVPFCCEHFTWQNGIKQD